MALSYIYTIVNLKVIYFKVNYLLLFTPNSVTSNDYSPFKKLMLTTVDNLKATCYSRNV